jgi:sarcosine oxidase subunit alpha
VVYDPAKSPDQSGSQKAVNQPINKRIELPTSRIDPSRQLAFTYRGKKFHGFKGDTVATALYANGVRLFSRSLKYHRPRGIYSLDGESGNCLMEVNGIPNVHAEQTFLKNNMTVESQNILGTPAWDLLGILDKFHWAMPAGFYYRRFHKPYRLWPFFMKQLRKIAGLGRLNPNPSEKKSDELYINAEVCVVGAGPAGMRAALSAAQHGVRVVLLEARPWSGGAFDYRASEYSAGVPLFQRAKQLAARVEQAANVRIFRQATLLGIYNDNLITACQKACEEQGDDECYIEIRAESIVVATGCTERPLIFENNERPGVMQADCAQRLARTYGLLPGRCAVFSIGHDLGLEAAVDLADLGLTVACVADCRYEGQDPELIRALAERQIPYLQGWVAAGARGAKTLKKVWLTTTDGAVKREFNCDLLVSSAGLSTVPNPLFLTSAQMVYDTHTGLFLPRQLPPKIHAAGRMLGYHHPGAIEASGHLAGLLAVSDCAIDVEKQLTEARDHLNDLPGPPRGCGLVRAPGRAGRQFICFDEDVTVNHIYQACEMGFDRPELAKRFTAAGTGPTQAGIPGQNLPMAVARYQGKSLAAAAPTTVRPPLSGTLLGTYAGRNADIYKQTPLHRVQIESNAVFRRVGPWKRARYFAKDATARAEIKGVRNKVGLIDVSTLGKFRLFGPDALKALQRVYVGDLSKMSPGKLKYSAMCNDDGCLIDDGVVVQLGENDYYFTTSTGRAGATAEWFRYQTRFDNWCFHIVNLTDAFGAINVAGPRSREVIEHLTDEDVSNPAFPYMGYREIRLRNAIDVRVLRLGFVGELSFEIHIPASYTPTVWNWLLQAGKDMGILPFGLEAQNVLRLEKGHIIIGVESEIRTTLHDLGMGFLWERHKPEAKTIGAFALKETEDQQGRLKLVGFKMNDAAVTPKEGSLIVDEAIQGYVCSARYSECLDAAIGMALVESALTEPGTPLKIFEGGTRDPRYQATVVTRPFYDPEGKRMKI